ncbi:hypothetical protein GJ744_010945 [Endocarpon pusillum]|uniref:Uncharacterized protein n=1 Tax=Endocarpon pusillum TaxID=364733 RepID=A0A8H7E2M6_9EURO|nr:hypothetical protein GJ744_010945 [Endocarpon pusillum]
MYQRDFTIGAHYAQSLGPATNEATYLRPTKAVVRAERSLAAAELRGWCHLFQEVEGHNLQHAAFGRKGNNAEAKLARLVLPTCPGARDSGCSMALISSAAHRYATV